MKERASPAPARFAATTAAWVLTAVVLAAYLNSFKGPFVFDDTKSIVGNASLRHLWPLSGPLSPPADLGVAGRPILNLSLAVNFALGGTAVGGYHALNLLIHLLGTLTLFGLVRRTLEWLRANGCPAAIGQSPELFAFLIALLWAVHPLQTSSVTYIIQRAESLMGLFYLLTLYCFVRSASPTSSGGGADRPGTLAGPGAQQAYRDGPLHLEPESPGGFRSASIRMRWDWMAVICCGLGMATKEVMVTAPLMVLLYDRTFIAGTFGAALRKRPLFYTVLAATWLILITLIAGLPNRGTGFGYGVTAWDYALTESIAIVRYLGLAIWPHPLLLDYNLPIMTRLGPVLPYGLTVLLLLGITVWGFWRRPIVGFLGAWFFLILAPTSSLVPVALQPMAENRMYLPLAAMAALLVGVAAEWWGKRTWIGGCALAALWAGLTVERNSDYRTEVGIWTDTVNRNPANPRAQYNLGTVLLKSGQPGEAIPHLEQSARLAPTDPEAVFNLGLALAGVGRWDESIVRYQEALRLKPGVAAVENNLGIALGQVGRRAEAILHFSAALHIDPGLAEAEANWGNTLYVLGQPAEAAAYLAQAVRLRPDMPLFRIRFGMALAQAGHPEEAVPQFQAALKLNPDDADTEDNLGLLLRAMGQPEEAQRHVAAAAAIRAGQAR